VEVHANAAEQVILGKYLERPDWAPGAEFLYMLVLGLLLIAVLPWLGPGWGAWAAGLGLFVAVRLPWEAFVRHYADQLAANPGWAQQLLDRHFVRAYARALVRAKRNTPGRT
jgi:adenylate cyclase